MSKASIPEKEHNTQESNITRLCDNYHVNDTERGKSLFVSFFFIQLRKGVNNMQELIRKGFNKMQKLIKKPNNAHDKYCCICIEATEDLVHIEIFKGVYKMYEGEIEMTVCQNCVKTHAQDLVEGLQNLYLDIMDETDGWFQLIIQSNLVRYSPDCYLCGEVTKTSVPFEIFEAESKKVVCESCAQTLAPSLVEMLRDWYKKHEEDFLQMDGA